MKISNSDLKVLLTLHNYLPQTEEQYKYCDPDYVRTITRYEKILIKLLEQKIQENEQTRYYIEKGYKNSIYGKIVSEMKGENYE